MRCSTFKNSPHASFICWHESWEPQMISSTMHTNSNVRIFNTNDFASETTFSKLQKKNKKYCDNNGGASIDTLCQSTRAHINIEYCGFVKACTYFYKYLYKGSDWMACQLKENNEAVDE